MNTMAELDVTFVRPDGTKTRGAIRIGQPYVVDDGEARCPVALVGLYERLPDIAGQSTLQALLLATQLCERLLTDFIEKGGRVLDDEGEEPFEMEAYFGPPRVPSAT